jgi:hypothetical protein
LLSWASDWYCDGVGKALAPVDCRYYFADYFRGRETEKCRLIERNSGNRRPWRRALCDSCPVPGILRETTCRHLALEAQVGRKWALVERVEVYAICTEHVAELMDARFCPQCDAERRKGLTS